jgi:hypothetical protein
MRVSIPVAIEMIKTITERMKRRAEGRQRIKQAEERRAARANRRAAAENPKRPSVGIIDDADFGQKPLQRRLKEVFQ